MGALRSACLWSTWCLLGCSTSGSPAPTASPASAAPTAVPTAMATAAVSSVAYPGPPKGSEAWNFIKDHHGVALTLTSSRLELPDASARVDVTITKDWVWLAQAPVLKLRSGAVPLEAWEEGAGGRRIPALAAIGTMADFLPEHAIVIAPDEWMPCGTLLDVLGEVLILAPTAEIYLAGMSPDETLVRAIYIPRRETLHPTESDSFAVTLGHLVNAGVAGPIPGAAPETPKVTPAPAPGAPARPPVLFLAETGALVWRVATRGHWAFANLPNGEAPAEAFHYRLRMLKDEQPGSPVIHLMFMPDQVVGLVYMALDATRETCPDAHDTRSCRPLYPEPILFRAVTSE
jgi:hypothetical protein